ncbi:putative lambdoid prophage Rac integrase domain protein [Escherichia coli P0302293.9]|nr:putative lambdoid prophage Rac integrase domain protein [Escherichia coli P0302293.9]
MVTTRVIKTFGELCDIWTKIKETELTTNTMKKTKSQLKTLRIIICESTPISHIRYSDILNYRNELLHGETLYLDNPRSNKKGRTVRTVDNYIALLCSLLRFAYQSGFISTKPFWICPYISRHLLSLNPLLACCRRYSRGER